LTFGRKANTELRYVGYSSMYNGLQVKLDKRFSGGLAMTTAYTFSKGLGYQSEDSTLEFFINPRRKLAAVELRPKAFLRAKLCVRTAVWERQAAFAVRPGLMDPGRMAGQRHPDHRQRRAFGE